MRNRIGAILHCPISTGCSRRVENATRPETGRRCGRGAHRALFGASPAARARATIQAVKRAAEFDTEINYDETIYGATSPELLKLIRHLPAASNCALMVGHNPGFEDLVGRLTRTHERMPTAALACVEFDLDQWADVEDRKGRLVWLLTPKQLD